MSGFGFSPKARQLVRFENHVWMVLSVKGTQSQIESLETGDRKWVENEFLSPEKERQQSSDHLIPWVQAQDDQKELAQIRLQIIEEYLALPRAEQTRAAADRIAKQYNRSGASLYVWLRKYDGTLDSMLIGRHLNSKPSRLDTSVEDIIESAFREVKKPTTLESKQLHQSQRIHVDMLFQIIEERCIAGGLPVPSKKTIQRRQKARMTNFERAEMQKSKKEALRFQAALGSPKDATFPYAVLQIDHTLMDIMIVDDEGRVIGRPWITVAIDVFSRCVVSFRLSLEPPSYAMVGLVLSRAILPKMGWLTSVDPTANFTAPFYGKPTLVMADNAKEFRSKALLEACRRFNIEFDWRPKGQPHFGAHIERLMGTFSKALHLLPGATLKPDKAPYKYNPEKHAIFTLLELEKHMVHEIYGIYHHTYHEGIKTTPLQRYCDGLENISGAPEVISGENARKLEIFFMPAFEATIQRDGVTQHHITWASDAFKRIIAHYGTGNGKAHKTWFYHDIANMKRIFCVDPLDRQGRFIEAVWKIDQPEYALWEIKSAVSEARELAKQTKADPINQAAVFKAAAAQRAIREQQAERSKTARREKERQKMDSARRVAQASKPSRDIVSEPPPQDVSKPVEKKVFTPSGRTERDF